MSCFAALTDSYYAEGSRETSHETLQNQVFMCSYSVFRKGTPEQRSTWTVKHEGLEVLMRKVTLWKDAFPCYKAIVFNRCLAVAGVRTTAQADMTAKTSYKKLFYLYLPPLRRRGCTKRLSSAKLTETLEVPVSLLRRQQ